MHHEAEEKRGSILRLLLLRLEDIQRDIGEVQRELIALLGEDDQQPPGVSKGMVEELDDEPDSATAQPEPIPTLCIHPADWLSQRQIEVLRTSPRGELDPTLDRLASFLGERFATIRPFYEAVKRRVGGHPYPRALKLTDAPPRVISDICQFANQLHNNGFLSQYSYNRGTRTLVFDPQMDGRVINFFTGDWLERYVLITVLERVDTLLPEGTRPIPLTKAVVALPNGQETELDILLGLPDRVLWFECKTSEWQEHARKFGDIARCLALPRHQAALVLLDPLTEEQERSASALSRMTAINPEKLEGFIEAALASD